MKSTTATYKTGTTQYTVPQKVQNHTCEIQKHTTTQSKQLK